MAEIAESGGGGHEKGGKKRPKKGSTRVDMTPMVDLAFLLLTFFVLTSTFSKPKIMSLAYPAKVEDNDPNIKFPKINNAITFLLSEDKIFYYKNQFYAPGNPEGHAPTQLEETNFGPDGVRKLLADNNKFIEVNKKKLDEQLQKKQIADTTYKRLLGEVQTKQDALKVLIKSDSKATCKNFIDLIDELKIANIGSISPVDMLKSENDLLQAKLNSK